MHFKHNDQCELQSFQSGKRRFYWHSEWVNASEFLHCSQINCKHCKEFRSVQVRILCSCAKYWLIDLLTVSFCRDDICVMLLLVQLNLANCFQWLGIISRSQCCHACETEHLVSVRFLSDGVQILYGCRIHQLVNASFEMSDCDIHSREKMVVWPTEMWNTFNLACHFNLSSWSPGAPQATEGAAAIAVLRWQVPGKGRQDAECSDLHPSHQPTWRKNTQVVVDDDVLL